LHPAEEKAEEKEKEEKKDTSESPVLKVTSGKASDELDLFEKLKSFSIEEENEWDFAIVLKNTFKIQTSG